MKKIIFRAYLTERKRMVYPTLVQWDKGKPFYIDWEPDEFGKNSEANSRFELMQFTGLKDKNGKEIYEGDILKCDWNDSRYPVHNIGPVKWNEREACWNLGEGGTAKDDAEAHFEVIGNIYESKHLLDNIDTKV